MRPLFIHEPLAWALTWGSLLLLRFLESRSGSFVKSSSGGGSRDRSLLAIAVLVWGSFAAAILAAVENVATIGGPRWWPLLVGTGLIWVGLGLRIWSIRTLGRFFALTVVIQEDHRVVDSGPYRLLRHPSYLGMIVAMTGLGLTIGDWLSVALMLLGTTTAFVIRITVEERALLRSLGEEYAAYAGRRARLIPGVY